MEVLISIFIFILLINEQTKFLAIIVLLLFLGSIFQLLANNIINIIIIAGIIGTYTYLKKKNP